MIVDPSLVAFLSGVLGVVITLAFQHVWTELQKKEARTFLAHTLAFEFERYAIACAEALANAEPDDPEIGRTPGSVESLPEALNLPQSPAYQWLGEDLRERIFAFPQDIHVARRGLAYISQIADSEDYDEEAERRLAEFGLKAAAIATDLRRKNGIAARTLKSGRWAIMEFLQAKANPRDPSIPF